MNAPSFLKSLGIIAAVAVGLVFFFVLLAYLAYVILN